MGHPSHRRLGGDQFVSLLSWRRDPGFEQRMLQYKQRRIQHEQQIKQLERETEQLRQENARLKALNAKGRALLSCIDQHCFPPESSSISPTSTEPDCKPALP